MKANLKLRSLNRGAGVNQVLTNGLLDFNSKQKIPEKKGDVSSADAIDVIMNGTDMLASAAGVRSPYYVIGEIDNKTESATTNKWIDKAMSAIGSSVAIRAVQDIIFGNDQEGVIIDGMTDMSGEFSVSFTKNPMMYLHDGVVDSRVRNPAKIQMTVGVSNYKSDNALEELVSGASNYFESALTGMLSNTILYGGNTRAQSALYRLRWLMENGKPFTVYTPHGIYENMLISAIKPRSNDNNLDMLFADIEFEEVIMYTYYRGSAKELMDSGMPKRTAISAVEKTPLQKLAFWQK